MNQLALISERIEGLWYLSGKDVIFFDDLQPEFRNDLRTFITGETLSLKEGKLVIGRNLYKKWLEKIQAHGFDYEIDFK
ncbi:hypothetical protein [uncultured Chitinophaga sp.]|uniref:hypothetical protein n=1 Tax=uncultured Chitinophaga sp. TaxID=339340 RepID=UPI0025D8D104|nr:hypothetical protein [uncultured Chitinophaga sp.]